MKPLMDHQKEALSDAYYKLGQRFMALSDAMDAPRGETKAAQEAWDNTVRDAEAAAGWLCAHDMGLGKTVVGRRLAAVSPEWVKRWGVNGDLSRRFKRPKILVLCPNSAKLNWEREWKEWSRPGEDDRLLVVNSDRDEFRMAMLQMLLLKDDDPEKLVQMVMSYDTLRCRIDDGILGVQWDLVIMDEIQAFRNTDSQRTQAAYRLNALLRVGLSGTPYTNKPDQLWSAITMLQGYSIERTSRHTGQVLGYIRRSPIWESRERFINKYCEWESSRWGSKITGGRNLSFETCNMPCCRSKWEWSNGRYVAVKKERDRDKCQSLHERLGRELMHRKRTAEVLNLPPWHLVDVPVDMTREQERIYRRLVNGLLSWIDSGEFGGSIPIKNVLAQMTHAFTTCAHLGQLANGIAKQTVGDSIVDHSGVTGQMLARVPENQRSGKLNWLLEFVEDQLDGEKAIIVTEFAVTARIILSALTKAGYGTVIIDGQTKAEQRDANVRAFQTDPDVVAVIITRAGYEAINLQAARYVVLFGKVSWVPGEVLQAIKRAHRIGTEGTVTVFRLYHEGTIEVWLNQLLGTKAEDFQNAIDGGQGGIAERMGRSFSRGELIDVFEGRTR